MNAFAGLECADPAPTSQNEMVLWWTKISDATCCAGQEEKFTGPSSSG